MSRLISVGSKFPEFEKTAVVSIEKGKEFEILTNNFANDEGRWTVMFWWPMDFTLLCPTEIVEFNNLYKQFEDRNTTIIGASTDSQFVHLAWRKDHDGLRNLQFPLLADTSKSLGEELGILNATERVAYRATFIIDPQNVIRWLSIYDLSVGRNIDEVLRVLDALQTDQLCPCNWEKGEETIAI